MLRSEAAKLANNVIDGAWKKGLYPENNVQVIASGLVWRMLGSPNAEDRWRAAHSIRCFARFKRWDIIDALVKKLADKTAESFQASELTFYFLHARLWLLIALARMSIDHPKEIARYKDDLFSIATNTNDPHVLMQHFASSALIACVDAQALLLPKSIEEQLRAVNISPHPRAKEEKGRRPAFYDKRPESAIKPMIEFGLDYDFYKHNVESLSCVFGKPCWDINDTMSEIVQHFDPNISSMYISGGRETRHRDTSHLMGTDYHTYGQQLGWHSFFIAAGKLLNNFPVISDSMYEDPWGNWLRSYVLTRKDGFWLSDGTDRMPIDSAQILLEKKKNCLVLTGDKKKLMLLAGIADRVSKELIVKGSWYSADNIRVEISSALVPPKNAQRLALKLTRDEPMLVYVPTYHNDEGEDDHEHQWNERNEYTPWIVCPSRVARIDEHDPYGTPCANSRPYLSRDYATTLSLSKNDPFGRNWINSQGTAILRAEAWGRKAEYSETGPYSGLRLYCSTTSLKQILKKHDRDLLLLITLQRYEKKGYRTDSQYTHTVAVVRISKNLNQMYFKGRVNCLHKSLY